MRKSSALSTSSAPAASSSFASRRHSLLLAAASLVLTLFLGGGLLFGLGRQNAPNQKPTGQGVLSELNNGSSSHGANQPSRTAPYTASPPSASVSPPFQRPGAAAVPVLLPAPPPPVFALSHGDGPVPQQTAPLSSGSKRDPAAPLATTTASNRATVSAVPSAFPALNPVPGSAGGRSFAAPSQSDQTLFLRDMASLASHAPLFPASAHHKNARSDEGGTAPSDPLLLTDAAPSVTHFAHTRANGFTWNGGSTSDNNWTSGGNWGGVAPDPAANADVIFAGTQRLTPNLNIAYTVNSVAFAPGAGAFNLVGSNTLTVGAGGITNSSANRQTISLGSLVVGAAQTWNVGGGGLSVSSPMSGSSGLTVSGTGGLFLSGNNSGFTGGITATAGNAFGATVGTNTTLNLAGTNAAGKGTVNLNGGMGTNGTDATLTGNGVDGVGGGAAVLNVTADNALAGVTTLTLSGGTGGNAGQPYANRISGGGGGGGGGAAMLNVSSANGLAGVNTIRLTGGGGGVNVGRYVEDRFGNPTGTVFITGGGRGGTSSLFLNFPTADNTVSTNAALLLRVGTNGATIGLSGGGPPTVNSGGVTVTLNGNHLSVGGLDSIGSTGLEGGISTRLIVQNGSSSAASVLTVGSDNANHNYGGLLVNGGVGTLSLVKTGTGTQTLTGANTYTGGTTVSMGTLIAGHAPGQTTSTALGTGSVRVESGATLSVGEALNTGATNQPVSTLSATSLVVAGSDTPALTFNLGNTNASDRVSLTGTTGSVLSLSSSGSFTIAFASATGMDLGAGTYTLMSFSSPHAGALSSLNLSDFKAVTTGGNLNSIQNGQFAFTLDGSNNVTGLNFSILGGTTFGAATPEPSTAALLVPLLVPALLLYSRRKAPNNGGF